MEKFNKIIIGRSIVISTSNIRNTRPIRKNCLLNGIRLIDMGSNPHSKGDFFSRDCDFLVNIRLIVIRAIGIINIIIIIMTVVIIVYLY